MIIDCEIDFSISKKAIPEVNNLLIKSKHKDPFLAIIWHGSGTTEKDMVYRWDIMAHNKSIFEYVDYLRFESCGFTLYATYDDLEYLKSELSNLMLDVVDEKLIIRKR